MFQLSPMTSDEFDAMAQNRQQDHGLGGKYLTQGDGGDAFPEYVQKNTIGPALPNDVASIGNFPLQPMS